MRNTWHVWTDTWPRYLYQHFITFHLINTSSLICCIYLLILGPGQGVDHYALSHILIYYPCLYVVCLAVLVLFIANIDTRNPHPLCGNHNRSVHYNTTTLAPMQNDRNVVGEMIFISMNRNYTLIRIPLQFVYRFSNTSALVRVMV